MESSLLTFNRFHTGISIVNFEQVNAGKFGVSKGTLLKLKC